MRLVVVSGMHRSGTSAVARIINLLGIDLGDEDRLMEAKADNPTGFWENLSLSGFNDDLLGFLGGRWDDPPVLLDGWETAPSLDPWRERARTLVTEQLSGEIAGWKDPRMSLLLPFWRTVVPIEPGVLVLRHPKEVAASLGARDDMPAEVAAELWLRYVVAARSNDPDALVLAYDDLFTDLEGTVERLVDHLRVDPPPDDVRTSITSFLDPGLRHHQEEGSAGPPEMVLADLTFDAVRAGRDRSLIEALAGSFAVPVLGESVGALRDVVARLEEHRDDLIRQRDVAVGLRDQGLLREDELRRERDAYRDRFEHLAARAASFDERLAMKSAQMERLEATGMRLREELARGLSRAEEAESLLAAARNRIAELTRSPLAGPRAWVQEWLR